MADVSSAAEGQDVQTRKPATSQTAETLANHELQASSSSVVRVRRSSLDIQSERQIYGRTAGRCEFEGCNQFLLEHHVTFAEGNFAEKAHIVAFSPGGPRGDEPLDREYINTLANLMLLCPHCHKLIDDDPEGYPVELLRKFKAEHEERIHRFTEFKPESSTRVLTMVATVRRERCAITEASVRAALARTNFDPRESLSLDLCNLTDTGDPSYWNTASREITQKVSSFVESPRGSTAFQPISVFAIARIPLLVHLGAALSSKVPVRVYNRQLLPDDWTWRDETRCQFEFQWLRESAEPGVALLVSLSGIVQPKDLPLDLQQYGSIGEITIVDGTPSRTCLQAEESVESFRKSFQESIQEACKRGPRELAIVPAVPTAAAVHIGRDLLPRAHPPVKIYDWNGVDKYEYTLTVNNHE